MSKYESAAKGFRTSQAWYQKPSMGTNQVAPMMTYIAAFGRLATACFVN